MNRRKAKKAIKKKWKFKKAKWIGNIAPRDMDKILKISWSKLLDALFDELLHGKQNGETEGLLK
jgi:hypothetical protein